MKLIVATNNAHKLTEFKRILEPMGYTVCGQREMGVEIEVEEKGSTFAENALLKAAAIHKATGLTVVADDSGLCVDALDGAPGVYSARYAGENATDADRNQKLLQNMANVADDVRTAAFVSAIALVFSDDDIIQCQGECKGEIGYSPLGENGFGYDPIFMIGDKSFAQLTSQQKDEISHRGRALEKLEQLLKQRNKQA